MIEILREFYNSISIIDLIYLILTILSLVKCYRKGFVLSILAMSKWLFAYIMTLIIFPNAKPYVKDMIDSEYILDIVVKNQGRRGCNIVTFRIETKVLNTTKGEVCSTSSTDR